MTQDVPLLDRSELTPKQQLFVDGYLATFNATEACRRAGYQGNDNTLRQTGFQNLTKPNIQAALSTRLHRITAKTEKQVIDVYDEFCQNLEFVKKLRDACVEWLNDPNGDGFSLAPRDTEIDIIHTVTLGTLVIDKRERLDDLLLRLQNAGIRSPEPFVKTVDLREYALKTLDRIDTTLDKFAKLSGAYTDNKANPLDITSALNSFAKWIELNPKASHLERIDAIKQFAALGKVDEKILAEKAGVQVIEAVQ